MSKSFVTTYCNHAHRVSDGKPIRHECAIIPPAALRAEIAGDFNLACALIERGKTEWRFGERALPTMRRGVRAP